MDKRELMSMICVFRTVLCVCLKPLALRICFGSVLTKSCSDLVGSVKFRSNNFVAFKHLYICLFFSNYWTSLCTLSVSDFNRLGNKELL